MAAVVLSGITSLENVLQLAKLNAYNLAVIDMNHEFADL